jgi:hypothetical protein
VLLVGSAVQGLACWCWPVCGACCALMNID